jgi:hypothetical protein
LYATHPTVRRVWAVRNEYQLRILVRLEPTHDDSDAYPASLAHRDAWKRELLLCAIHQFDWSSSMSQCSMVAAIDAESVIVTTLGWRDPTSASQTTV